MIYLKQPITNIIESFDSESSMGDFYGNWEVMSEGDVAVYQLEKAKLSKIAQLKVNRDTSNLRPLTSGQAYEIIETEAHEFEKTTNKVYFAFSLAATSQPATDPNSIILGTLLASMSDPSFYLRYSCAILEGEVIRKGYVAIDAIAANEIRIHITQRVEAAVAYANSLEKEINLASSLEELEEINIEF